MQLLALIVNLAILLVAAVIGCLIANRLPRIPAGLLGLAIVIIAFLLVPSSDTFAIQASILNLSLRLLVFFLGFGIIFGALFQPKNTLEGGMYSVLVGYAAISVLPFIFMALASVSTLSEANSTKPYPKAIDTKSDITPCIIYTKDTFIEGRDTVTKRRWAVNISEEVEGIQRYGGSTHSPTFVERDTILEIPFFTNYCAAWSMGDLGKHMWNTVRIVAIQVTGTMIIATLAAYAFARMDFVGKNVIFSILLVTLMIPSAVQILPSFLMVTRIGEWTAEIIFGFLEFLGNQNIDVSRFDDICSAGRTPNCWKDNWPALTIPFMAPTISIFLLRQHFQTIPSELWDAARIDGAGHFRFLMQIVLPISKAALFVVLLFAFIAAWNELAWAILVTSSDDWRPIAVGLYNFLDDDAGNLSHLRMAGSMIAILPILILYAFTQRQFIEGLSQSGLKG